MSGLRIVLKNVFFQFANRYRIHYRKKDWRNFAIKYIDDYILTKEQKRQIMDYYKPYFKSKALFHEFYTEKTGKFYVNYIPDDIYYCYIDPFFNDWEKAKYIDNKCIYQNLFPDVLQPEILIKKMNGLWFDSSNNIVSKNDINRVLVNENELFIKQATESEGGHGVFYYNKDNDFWSIVRKIPDKEDIVVQRVVKQHKRLNDLNNSSVNTIRVLSLLTLSGVKIYSCILRMGINGSKVDNASSGGITCGITNNGKLKNVAFSKSGKKYFKHPDSNIAFLDYEVPGFKAIVELVLMLHCNIPHFRLVSWDFAVNENERPVLIEANLHYGELDFHQLNNGPIFGDDTCKILEEVFRKS